MNLFVIRDYSITAYKYPNSKDTWGKGEVTGHTTKNIKYNINYNPSTIEYYQSLFEEKINTSSLH